MLNKNLFLFSFLRFEFRSYRRKDYVKNVYIKDNGFRWIRIIKFLK